MNDSAPDGFFSRKARAALNSRASGCFGTCFSVPLKTAFKAGYIVFLLGDLGQREMRIGLYDCGRGILAGLGILGGELSRRLIREIETNLRADRLGFASLEANRLREGIVVTQPVLSSGNRLTINARCRPGGSVSSRRKS